MSALLKVTRSGLQQADICALQPRQEGLNAEEAAVAQSGEGSVPPNHDPNSYMRNELGAVAEEQGYSAEIDERMGSHAKASVQDEQNSQGRSSSPVSAQQPFSDWPACHSSCHPHLVYSKLIFQTHLGCTLGWCRPSVLSLCPHPPLACRAMQRQRTQSITTQAIMHS